MTLLGTLLKNRRDRDDHAAWNRPNLQAPDTFAITSGSFEDGAVIPLVHVGRRIGGQNLSPELTWSAPPPGTCELLLVVEDLDVPLPTPAVHCLALIDPSRLDTPHHLPAGALSARDPAVGVRIGRSTVTRGYHGPEPIKGHGPHRYTFQVFALASDIGGESGDAKTLRTAPRALLASIPAPVVARGHLTGVYER
jgi:phosphatidylethanolamine-binding protein (PEBP) family uncharacterized protein